MKPRMDGEKIQVNHLPLQQGMEGKDGDFCPIPVVNQPPKKTKEKYKTENESTQATNASKLPVSF